jgi:hypothetical protein
MYTLHEFIFLHNNSYLLGEPPNPNIKNVCLLQDHGNK